MSVWAWLPWTCRRKRKRGHHRAADDSSADTTTADVADPLTDASEATQLLCREQRGLERARANRRDVDDLTEQLRRHREVNHFAELIGDSLRKEGRGR